ncbi:MAG: Fe-S cluster assembly sulfur transfer protein SufU [Candidatus Aminicenantia bacterium]
MELDEFYKEIIIDHYNNPRNFGNLPSHNISGEGVNPLCGDEIHLELLVKDNVIEDVRFHGTGCSISKASASMMTEAIKGKKLDYVRKIAEKFKELLFEGKEDEELGELEALKGVRIIPIRIKCAVLSWNVLEEALKNIK